MPEGNGAPEGTRLRAIVEALVFAAVEPLTLDDLVDLFPGTERDTLAAALEEVAAAYESPERGLMVQRVAGGYRLGTRPDLGEWVRALFRSRNRRRLSAQALETLAIVAYRQPITTPEIQAIRGIDPSSVLDALLEKRLVRIMGRKKVVGKPFLYGTTPEFLAHFGLNSLQDLPDISEFGALLGTSVPALAPLPLETPGPAGVPLQAVAAGPFEEDGADRGLGRDIEEEDDDDGDDDSEQDDDGDDS